MKSTNNKALDAMLRRLREEGVDLDVDAGGRGPHIKVVLANGHKVPLPRSLTGDGRAVRSLEQQIRRASALPPGVPIRGA